jgi:hypothetical protein
MKKLYKAALLAALGLGSMVTAQATTYNGDLIVGFTTQSGSDLIYDLGAASSLTSGETWNLNSILSSSMLNNANLNWGVIGNAGSTAWTTTDGTFLPNKIPNASTLGTLNTPTKSIFSNMPGAGYFSIAATDDNSWNQQTISGSLSTQYWNAYENPNVVGLTSDQFYSVVDNSSRPSLLGSFALSGNDYLTYTAVPEPITFGAFAGAGLLLVSLRNQLRRKQA